MPKAPALICLPLVLVLGACMQQEPYERPGTWRASGANDANLRAMIANPGDLERGAAPVAPARGEMGALAASRLSFPSGPAGGGGSGGGGGGGGSGGGSSGSGASRAAPGGIPALPPVLGAGGGRR